MKNIKEKIAGLIVKHLDGVTLDQVIANLSLPQEGFGDLTFRCFNIAKSQRRNPALMAKELCGLINGDVVERVDCKGGFLNLYINKNLLVAETLNDISSQGVSYGCSYSGGGKLVVVDYSAPNVGKPLHVGHIRSTIMGDSIIRMLNFTGHRTFGINYLGDIGLHIGKIITAYQLWGSKERMRDDPEKEVLDLYIEFGKRSDDDSSLDEKAKNALEKLEAGDLELTELWKYITEMSLKAFDRVYSLLDVKFDEFSGQSHFSDLGKEEVRKALALGVARRDDSGAVIVDFSKFKKSEDEKCLPEKVILRNDGTAIYSTQDLGSAVSRYNKFHFDKMLYVVANEQELYFKQVFKTLDLMGYSWAKDCFHVSFGMINLEEGRMSTREGVIVFLEEVLNKAVSKARAIIEERNPELKSKDDVAKIVGIGALKYMVLGVDYRKNIEFSWDRALSFDGDSGPYIQYGYARASSILRKAGVVPEKFNPGHFDDASEFSLVKKLALFPEMVEDAARKYSPNIVANYASELTSLFNQFYNKVHVLDSGEKLESKLFLVDSYRVVVKNALSLLGMGVVEEM